MGNSLNTINTETSLYRARKSCVRARQPAPSDYTTATQLSGKASPDAGSFQVGSQTGDSSCPSHTRTRTASTKCAEAAWRQCHSLSTGHSAKSVGCLTD
jgi:hypothetical protein